MSSFKHKDIVFPEYIDLEKNYFLYNVLDNFKRLKLIYDGEIEYIYSDYPTLINSFEQLYKGAVKELAKYHDDCKMSEDNFSIGHRFKQFASIVNHKISLSSSLEGYKKICEYLSELEQNYNSVRYYNHIPFETFQRDFRRFEYQLDRIVRGLEKEYSKFDISSEEEKDLENW